MFRTLANAEGKFEGFENEKQKAPKVRLKLPRKYPRRKVIVQKAK